MLKEFSMEVDFENLEMQKWNIPMDRAQIVAAQNGVICTIIVFTPGDTVIKMSQMALFYFPLMLADFWHQNKLAELSFVYFQCVLNLKNIFPLSRNLDYSSFMQLNI